MIFFAVRHQPTGRLFPLMKTGSTHYDFYDPPRRTRHRVELAPRIFESPRMAKRYISEYCRGIRTSSNFAMGEAVTYELPPNPRRVEDFKIIVIELTVKGTINV